MATKVNGDPKSPLLVALMNHKVTTEVRDLDHYRIHGGMAVETDFIIGVKPSKQKKQQNSKKQSSKQQGAQDLFDPFTLSKTYSSFRTLAQELKKASDKVTASGNNKEDTSTLSPAVIKVAKYCEMVNHLVDSQKTQYLGKVNYVYVKEVLAKQRIQIINDVLETTCTYFPTEIDSHPFLAQVASTVETFFLTDHCDLSAATGTSGASSTAERSEKKANKGAGGAVAGFVKDAANLVTFKRSDSAGDKSRRSHSVVVPYTRRTRRTEEDRTLDEQELSKVGEDAQLLLNDDRPQTEMVPSNPMSKFGILMDNNPFAFMSIAAVAVYVLHTASESKLNMDTDIALLAVFAAFCLGLHTPRPMAGGFDHPPTIKGTFRHDPAGRNLLRRSMAASTPRGSNDGGATTEDLLPDVIMGSPMDMFPEGAEIGSHFNCWSIPDKNAFQVRGPNYLTDKKKIPSGEFLFPLRGVDLFLTDTCPENVGSCTSVFGGNLREKATFIINFRLPWAVLVFYYEIPDRFINFLRAGYEDDFDKATLPSLDDMTPSDRCVCRFLLADEVQKNSTIKIVPYVVEGPWITKQVVGGKPALIGKKVPVNYVYQPAEDGKAAYLEADLDIAASSAARSILSMVRTYTQVLTIDLGFVIQGETEDELPEQMLVGSRLHGIDPLTAQPFPATTTNLLLDALASEDNESVKPVE